MGRARIELATFSVSERHSNLLSYRRVEAAHEVGMKCVVVAGSRPLYELGAADLVVRSLEDVSFMNLKKLFQEEQSDAIPLSDLEEEDF